MLFKRKKQALKYRVMLNILYDRIIKSSNDIKMIDFKEYIKRNYGERIKEYINEK